jgi:hypothetical protein
VVPCSDVVVNETVKRIMPGSITQSVYDPKSVRLVKSVPIVGRA